VRQASRLFAARDATLDAGALSTLAPADILQSRVFAADLQSNNSRGENR
jgi:hypothetical protein